MGAIIDLETYRERLRGILLIGGVGLSSNVYVLGRSDITLVDTGAGDELNRVLPRFEALKLRLESVSRIILTHSHPDHLGGLEEVLQHSLAKVMAHSSETPSIPKRVVKLRDGDTIPTEAGSLKVLHTPGHTRGSLCLYEPEAKILFSGDTVFADGSFGRTDMQTGDERAMLDSLKRLSSLEVDVLLPGHGNPLVEGALKQIKLAYEMARQILRAS